MEEVYFSDIQQRILQEIKNAKTEIKVAVAWFTDSSLFNLLIEKAKSGVIVQLASVDDEINNNSKVEFTDLAKVGGTIFLLKEKLMHNKFCLIDDKVIINGSYNWSNKAKSNYENITISRNNINVVKSFSEEFERIKVKAERRIDGAPINTVESKYEQSVLPQINNDILIQSLKFSLQNTLANIDTLYKKTGKPLASLTHISFALNCLESNLKHCPVTLSPEDKALFLLRNYPTQASFTGFQRQVNDSEKNFINKTLDELAIKHANLSVIKKDPDKRMAVRVMGLMVNHNDETIVEILREQYAVLVFELLLSSNSQIVKQNEKESGCLFSIVVFFSFVLTLSYLILK